MEKLYEFREIPNPEDFADKLDRAYGSFINNSDNELLIGQFRFTYDYKRTLFRMGDGIGLHERTGGLSRALSLALSCIFLSYIDIPSAGVTEVDEVFKIKLRHASTKITDLNNYQNCSDLDFLVYRLKNNQFSLRSADDATVQMLEEVVKSGFRSYHAGHVRGNSWDPI